MTINYSLFTSGQCTHFAKVFEIAEFLAVDLIRSQTVECGADPVKRWYRPHTLAKVMAPHLLLHLIIHDDWQRVRVHGAKEGTKCIFK